MRDLARPRALDGEAQMVFVLLADLGRRQFAPLVTRALIELVEAFPGHGPRKLDDIFLLNRRRIVDELARDAPVLGEYAQAGGALFDRQRRRQAQ